jgi:hypothetical protein
MESCKPDGAELIGLQIYSRNAKDGRVAPFAGRRRVAARVP